jgi:hypothetical protein
LSSITRFNDSLEGCATIQEMYCSSAEYIKFYSSNDYEKCLPECPLECDRQVFQLSTSASTYPTKSYYNFIKNDPNILRSFNVTNGSQISYNELRDNIAGVNIYYEDMSYLKVTENPQTEIIDLVSNFGGRIFWKYCVSFKGKNIYFSGL